MKRCIQCIEKNRSTENCLNSQEVQLRQEVEDVIYINCAHKSGGLAAQKYLKVLRSYDVWCLAMLDNVWWFAMFDAWRLLSLLHWMCKMCDSTRFTEIMVGSRQDEPIPQKPQWQKSVRQLVLQDHIWSWRLVCDRTASFPGVYSMVRGFAATWSLCTDNFQCWYIKNPRWIREVQDLLSASWVPLLVESTLGNLKKFLTTCG